jgi:hypothetical protein
MIDLAQWQQGNSKYLALAIAWLQLRLQWHIHDLFDIRAREQSTHTRSKTKCRREK